jgi:protein involved in polysaccharide export with SLBB domain
VLNAGSMAMTAVDRANKAIDNANKLTRLQTQDDLLPVLKIMSKRNITLKHKDGTQQRIDIPKYLATNDDRWNPYLREGDVVIVPAKDPTKNVFAIYGQINTPGAIEFVDGDSVLDAVKIGNGLTRLALSDSAIFSRLNQDGTALTNHFINLGEMIAGREPNIPLEPGDRIIIKKKVELREDYNVDVHGEVLYPGTYPITKNRTHLSEILRQAGGFTEFAALGSSVVIRQSYQTDNMETERLLSLRGEPSGSDSTGFWLATELRVRQQEVNVNFERLFTQHDSTQDIILQTQDQIIIPSRHQTIYVFGQVAMPGHVPFVDGQDSKYYIAKAGGYTDHANKGELKIIKAKTKQWLSPGDTRLEEGDFIWVPAEPDRPFGYYMTIASQAASVLSVVIGIGVLIIQVTK